MDHQDYDTKLEQVVETVDMRGNQDDNLIPLSSGVILERVPFSRNILMDLFQKFKEPKVPVFINPDKEREEENPNDPDYIAAKEKYDAEVGMALFDTTIVTGKQVL